MTLWRGGCPGAADPRKTAGLWEGTAPALGKAAVAFSIHTHPAGPFVSKVKGPAGEGARGG